MLQEPLACEALRFVVGRGTSECCIWAATETRYKYLKQNTLAFRRVEME